MKMKTVVLIVSVSVFLISCDKEKQNSDFTINRNQNSGENGINKSTESNLNKLSGESKNTLRKIVSSEVKNHIGDSLTVTGYIADIYLSDKVAYLNFENKFPKNLFSCAIFATNLNTFGDLGRFRGKNAEVTGRISSYKNKPQIILSVTDQIKIIQ